MIRHQKQIVINAQPEKVFALIETMPNKFPIYRILETKPFFFLRILFVDGFRSAMEFIRIKKPDNALILQIGDSLGPFKLAEFEQPNKYVFSLKSFFFNCRTGYTLSGNNHKTALNFDIIADNPTTFEKLWWIFIKPIHSIVAKKVLMVIKNKVELESES